MPTENAKREETEELTPEQKAEQARAHEARNAEHTKIAPVPFVTLKDTENDVTMLRHPIDALEILNAPDNEGKVKVSAGQEKPTSGVVANIKPHPEDPKRKLQAKAEEVIPLAPAVANVLGRAGVENPHDPESRREALGDDNGDRKASGGRKAGRRAKQEEAAKSSGFANRSE